MNNLDYQICSKCVMDTTDPKISFNEEGVCSHCVEFEEVTKKRWYPNDEGKKILEDRFSAVKEEGKAKDYDCILGLSGGCDSSYLALKIHEMGLRPLVVHIDGGWNSELAVKNIESIVSYCNWHLHTIVINWSEMRDLQLAYFKAAVSNQDVPQDHAFFAALYRFAVKNNIRYVLSGGNIATEAILPKSWGYNAMDSVNLKAIHKKFGKVKLKDYPLVSFFDYYFYFPFIRKMKVIRPLNFMPYNKELALKELKEKVGYKEYDKKHGESVFTKFFQNYYQPVKFGFDKRRPHFSSLIVSGQMTREEAIKELEKTSFDQTEIQFDKEYIAKKLGVSIEEFEKILQAPINDHLAFKNTEGIYLKMKKIQGFITSLLKKDISNYS